MTQKLLFSGLDCLPGQLDLFPTDGEPEREENAARRYALIEQFFQVAHKANFRPLRWITQSGGSEIFSLMQIILQSNVATCFPRQSFRFPATYRDALFQPQEV